MRGKESFQIKLYMYLEYKRQAGRIECHEDDIVDDHTEARKGAEDLQPFDARQGSYADQKGLHEGVQSDSRSQQRHTARYVRFDFLLISRT